jgi:DNA-binding response OmpR family regulator
VLVLDDAELLLRLAETFLDEDGCAVARCTTGLAERLPAAVVRPDAVVLKVLLDGEVVGHAVATAPIPTSAGYTLRIVCWTASTEYLKRATAHTARARLALAPSLPYDRPPLALLRHALAQLMLAGETIDSG